VSAAVTNRFITEFWTDGLTPLRSAVISTIRARSAARWFQ
jgi:hypothetical protein